MPATTAALMPVAPARTAPWRAISVSVAKLALASSRYSTGKPPGGGAAWGMDSQSRYSPAGAWRMCSSVPGRVTGGGSATQGRAAIDVKIGHGDMPGAVGEQEGHRVRDILRRR